MCSSDLATPANNTANRCALYIDGTTKPTKLHDVNVIGFGGNAITVSDSGFVGLASIQCENAFFKYNGAGIYFAEHGEYGVVNNCNFTDNYIGTFIQGGNNVVVGCVFGENVYGIKLDGETASATTAMVEVAV